MTGDRADWAFDVAVDLAQGVDWQPVDDPEAAARYPLATRRGLSMLSNILTADRIWRSLTKTQRELLLSTVAGYPIKARIDVIDRLIARGLLHPGSREATDAGRSVVAWRLL